MEKKQIHKTGYDYLYIEDTEVLPDGRETISTISELPDLVEKNSHKYKYVYIPLPSSRIDVEQCWLAQGFDAGNVIVHGPVYRMGWFTQNEVKKVEKKHENYVWEREEFTSSYSCEHIRSPFALKQFLESQTPQA